jgi:ADP-heptose:LPS heptosyltransferase
MVARVRSFVARRLEGVAFAALLLALAPAWLVAWFGAALCGGRAGAVSGRLGAAARRWGRFLAHGLAPFRRIRPDELAQEPPAAVWQAVALLEWLDLAGADAAPAAPEGRGRVLVVQLHHVGNALLSLPAVQAAAARHGAGRVDILAAPWNAAVFVRFAPGCRVFVYSPPFELLRRGVRRGARGLWGSVRFFRPLRRAGYDQVVSLGPPHALNLIVERGVCGRRWLGPIWPQDLYAPCAERVQTPSGDCTPERERLAAVARAAGWEAVEAAPFVPTREEDWTAQRLAERAARAPAGLVLLAPGAGIEAKQWRFERFAGLGERLVRELGYAVLVIGSPGERDLCRDVAARMTTPAASVAGETSIGELAALMKRSALLVCNDSGALHLAELVGLPTVSLFGPSLAAVWAPHGPDQVALQSPCHCAPCDAWDPRSACHVTRRCMEAIPVDGVLTAVRMSGKR